MQLSVTFSQTDRPITLPLVSSWTIQGLLYHAISSDPAFAGFLHDQGHTDGNRRFKLFCFSELQPSGEYRVNTAERTITYLSDVTLEVRSIHPYFIGLLFSYFTTHSTVDVGGNAVKVKKTASGTVKSSPTASAFVPSRRSPPTGGRRTAIPPISHRWKRSRKRNGFIRQTKPVRAGNGGAFTGVRMDLY